MPTRLHDLLSYFSTSITCQLDTTIFEGLGMFFFRNSEFLYETSFDTVRNPMPSTYHSGVLRTVYGIGYTNFSTHHLITVKQPIHGTPWGPLHHRTLEFLSVLLKQLPGGLL